DRRPVPIARTPDGEVATAITVEVVASGIGNVFAHLYITIVGLMPIAGEKAQSLDPRHAWCNSCVLHPLVRLDAFASARRNGRVTGEHPDHPRPSYTADRVVPRGRTTRVTRTRARGARFALELGIPKLIDLDLREVV